VARVLLVGCGCRGRRLAAALAGRGHAVRGTTRREEGLALIEEAGAEAVRADPDRLATLLPHLGGVSALCWLMGAAQGPPEAVRALHGPRLASMVETLVDTHVRGIVYEAAGGVEADVLEGGAATVESVAATFRMPAQVVRRPAGDLPAWVDEMADAVDRVLSA
jgi:uncharacterized protein YbjT (DUF2867 family)